MVEHKEIRNNIFPEHFKISRNDRMMFNGHKSIMVLFTGLPCSGKSTLANALEQKLFSENIKTFILDGDNLRSGINKNLSFSPADRAENLRIVSEISKLFIEAGVVVLAAFVAPYLMERRKIKNLIGDVDFVEIYVNTSLKVCEERDAKGLFKKARQGKINDFTGISAPYEPPVNPFLEINESFTVEKATDLIFKKLIWKIKMDI
ncbi:adenylyl-sulfate kinase [Muricauda sp. MAR_2010_75]|jgi:adenylyl-sulfate kinase|uniref:adenylyl-sulfate kinase n=1 Tax=Allomuricauda sp. MAR_2010_75 TaxID=1250232 RepID=UPI000565BF5E|nr:adenylyl-sulfate kinase [Muricauda sp. MAR_2010_75]